MTFDTTTTAHHRFERCVFFLFFCCFLFSLFSQNMVPFGFVLDSRDHVHNPPSNSPYVFSLPLFCTTHQAMTSFELSLSLSLSFYICNQIGVITSPCVWMPLCVMQGQLKKDPYPYLVINQIMTSLTFYVCNHGYFLSLSLSLSCKANLKQIHIHVLFMRSNNDIGIHVCNHVGIERLFLSFLV